MPCCCIFNGSNSKSTSELIDRLFPNEIIDDSSIWNIKNKYYEVDVQLTVKKSISDVLNSSNGKAAATTTPPPSPAKGATAIADSPSSTIVAGASAVLITDSPSSKEEVDIEAYLIYMDQELTKMDEKEEKDDGVTNDKSVVSVQVDSVNRLFSVEDIENLDEKEVQLIVVESRKCLNKELTDWIDSGTTSWELIDLSEDLSNGDDGSDDDDSTAGIFSSNGFERISEALQTTPWPNTRPPRPSTPSPPPLTPKKESNPSSTPPSSPVILDGRPASCAKGDEDDFEALFSQFAKLKSTSDSITDPNDRKKYAEKVVLSFWNAMGGDPEDIAGLSDDSDLAEGDL